MNCTMAKLSFNVSHYTRLENIFHRKGWNKDIIADKIKERYFRTLSLLDKDEQVLFLDLTERFTRISIDSYVSELVKVLPYLCGKNKNKKLYFARCISKDDLNKTKSSNHVLYQFKGLTLKFLITTNYEVIDDIQQIDVKCLNNGTALLVLVDDFIGTGDTAMKALGYVYECHPNLTNDSSVVFLSIASLQSGIAKIRDAGFNIYTSNVFRKGITDYYTGIPKDEKIQKMRNIERKLNVTRKFKLGYKKSEALICMNRCPNNTFPVYWYSKEIAPYER